MSPTARLLPQMARCVRYNLKVINTAPSLPSFRALHINCSESISRENDLAVISTEDCLWTSRTLSLTLCSVVSQIGDGSLESSCHHLDCPCHLLCEDNCWCLCGQSRHPTLEAWDTRHMTQRYMATTLYSTGLTPPSPNCYVRVLKYASSKKQHIIEHNRAGHNAQPTLHYKCD